MADFGKMYGLSETDRAQLAHALAVIKKIEQNTVNRPGDPSLDEQDNLFAPEVYAALTPNAGIPAIGREVGTGTFDPTSGIAISGTLCPIFTVQVTGSGTLLLPVKGVTTVPVFNLSGSAIGGGQFVLIHRDKYGTWLTDGAGAGGGGTQKNWGDIHYFRQHTAFADSARVDYPPGIIINSTQSSGTGVALTKDIMYMLPFFSGKGGTMNQITGHVFNAGAGSHVRFGVFDIEGGDSILPANKLFESGSVSASFSPSCTPGVVMTQGTMYWIGLLMEASDVQWYSYPSTNCFPIFGLSTTSSGSGGGIGIGKSRTFSLGYPGTFGSVSTGNIWGRAGGVALGNAIPSLGVQVYP